MKSTAKRHEIRTETADYTFKDGAGASILKTERIESEIESEKVNPYFFILGMFILFLISSYCLVQLLNSQGETKHEVQIRQTNVYRVIKDDSDNS